VLGYLGLAATFCLLGWAVDLYETNEGIKFEVVDINTVEQTVEPQRALQSWGQKTWTNMYQETTVGFEKRRAAMVLKPSGDAAMDKLKAQTNVNQIPNMKGVAFLLKRNNIMGIETSYSNNNVKQLASRCIGCSKVNHSFASGEYVTAIFANGNKQKGIGSLTVQTNRRSYTATAPNGGNGYQDEMILSPSQRVIGFRTW